MRGTLATPRALTGTAATCNARSRARSVRTAGVPTATLSPVMRPPVPAPRAARSLLAAAAACGAVALSGCQTQSPIQTDAAYQAADGVPVDLGAVQVRNLVIVADRKGGPGTISAAVLNRSGQGARITFSDQGSSPVTTTVPSYSEKLLSETDQVVLPTVSAAPGGVVQLQVRTAQSGTSVVAVPVLPPELYYKTLAPSASPTTSAGG